MRLIRNGILQTGSKNQVRTEPGAQCTNLAQLTQPARPSCDQAVHGRTHWSRVAAAVAVSQLAPRPCRRPGWSCRRSCARALAAPAVRPARPCCVPRASVRLQRACPCQAPALCARSPNTRARPAPARPTPARAQRPAPSACPSYVTIHFVY